MRSDTPAAEPARESISILPPYTPVTAGSYAREGRRCRGTAALEAGEGIRMGTPYRYLESVLHRGADAVPLNEGTELRSMVRAAISCE